MSYKKKIATPAVPTYQIHPDYKNKFKPSVRTFIIEGSK